MTSLPVNNLNFGLNGNPVPSIKSKDAGGFQEVWNKQNEGKTETDSQGNDNPRSVKKPGDSLKARDEHRVRTQKREPSRNVEERTDMSPEESEKVLEEMTAIVGSLVSEIAQQLEVPVEEVETAIEELGLEPAELLNAQTLGDLVTKLSKESDFTALVTNGELYENYKQLLDRMNELIQESAEELQLTPEQLKAFMSEAQSKVMNASLTEEMTQGTVSYSTEEIHNREVGPGTDRTEDNPEGSEEVTVDRMGVNVTDATVKEGQEKEQSFTNGNNRKENQTKQDNPMPNLMIQNIREHQFDPNINRVTETPAAWDTDTQDIMRQIMDYLKVSVKDDVSSMEMQLHPASLGSLQIQLASKGGVVIANFITQNEAVKAALESQMVQLQEQFEEQGVKVSAIEVTVQTHQFEQNLEQGRGNHQAEQEPARRTRIRRLNRMEGFMTEEVTEDDELAVRMMEANGNTVDYTA